jgi:hypothetical protein
MKSKVLILPGVASPICSPQINVYNEILKEASLRGIETELVIYPGQFDNVSITSLLSTTYVLNIETATKVVIERLFNLEQEEIQYFIIARSYGCIIALNSIKIFNPKKLQNIILWGTTPFETMFEHFQKDDFFENCKSKGTRFSPLNENCIPVEYLIKKYNHDAKVRLCCGTEDEICKPSYIDYLLSLHINRFEKVIIEGANHEGLKSNHPNFKNYINALLNV